MTSEQYETEMDRLRAQLAERDRELTELHIEIGRLGAVRERAEKLQKWKDEAETVIKDMAEKQVSAETQAIILREERDDLENLLTNHDNGKCMCEIRKLRTKLAEANAELTCQENNNAMYADKLERALEWNEKNKALSEQLAERDKRIEELAVGSLMVSVQRELK